MPMRVSLLFLALVLLFQTQAVFQAQEAMAASDHGRRTARFEVRMRAGKVERITIRVPSTGEFYVIDRFVEGDQAIKDEAEAFSLVERGLYGATACPGKAPCRSACAWAENARPFTRIRYKIPSGRLKLLWPLGKAEQSPLQLYAGASSHSNQDGDCLSPDGRYLSVYTFLEPHEDGGPKFPGVVDLKEKNLPAQAFMGGASRRIYGEDRYFDFGGWKKSEPHTLLFSWGGDDGSGKGESVDDEALPRP